MAKITKILLGLDIKQ